MFFGYHIKCINYSINRSRLSEAQSRVGAAVSSDWLCLLRGAVGQAFLYMHIDVCMHANMYVCLYVCMYVYVYDDDDDNHDDYL